MKAAFAFVWLLGLFGVVGTLNPAFLILAGIGMFGFFTSQDSTETDS